MGDSHVIGVCEKFPRLSGGRLTETCGFRPRSGHAWAKFASGKSAEAEGSTFGRVPRGNRKSLRTPKVAPIAFANGEAVALNRTVEADCRGPDLPLQEAGRNQTDWRAGDRFTRVLIHRKCRQPAAVPGVVSAVREMA